MLYTVLLVDVGVSLIKPSMLLLTYGPAAEKAVGLVVVCKAMLGKVANGLELAQVQDLARELVALLHVM